MHPAARGVSLVELMVTISIMAILLMAGIPSFGAWMQTTQIRTAAESIQNGLQLTRTEAIRRNVPMRFSLTDAVGKVAWSVDCVVITPNCQSGFRVRPAAEAGSNPRVLIDDKLGDMTTPLVTGLSLPSAIEFDGMGRVRMPAAGGPVVRMDVINPVLAEARRMVILLEPGGQIRMCDPLLNVATNPQGCV